MDGLDPCDFSPETENIFHSYAMLTAVNVSSDLDVIAWSGRGVVRNYGDMGIPTEPTVPDLYNRTIANLGANKFNYWESNKYQAEVILINLGTNDYSTVYLYHNKIKLHIPIIVIFISNITIITIITIITKIAFKFSNIFFSKNLVLLILKK